MQHLPGRPSISIAMATYNGEKFIAEQLATLTSQTYLPLELVISDDGSSDGTLDVIRSYVRTAPFDVRILPKHPRLGFSDNFLHAAEHCRGSHIAFCDQDDAWLPHKLEAQIKRLQKDRSLLALHRLVITDVALKPTGDIWDQGIVGDFDFEPLELMPYCTGWGNSMLFDRKLVHLTPRQSRPGQPESSLPLSHDTWVYVLAAGVGKVSHLLEPLLLYRQHDSSTYGIKSMPLRIKIRAAILVPEPRLIAERIFNERMADIFDEVSESQKAFAEQALAASRSYRDRVELSELRLQTYNGKRVSERLKAYQQSRAFDFYTPTWKSSLKEAAFGVLGFSHLLKPFLNRVFT